MAMGDVLSVLGYDISDFSDFSVTYDIMFATIPCLFHILFSSAFQIMSAVIKLEQEPEMKHIVSAALKEYTGGNADGVAMGDVLSLHPIPVLRFFPW